MKRNLLVLRRLSCAALLVLLSVACSGEQEADRPAGLENSGNMGGAQVGEPTLCKDAAERVCSVTFHQANGAKSCFTGIQFCEGGIWSECFDPANDPRAE
jgi:hypothetical protein